MRACQNKTFLHVVLARENHPAPVFQKPESLQKPAESAIDDFVTWYCSDPRLAFGKTVVLRWRIELEARRLAPATVNFRLAAVHRLACEAADSGILSPDLAAGIRRVKGPKRVGVPPENWLTPEQGRTVLQAPDPQRPKGSRNSAIRAAFSE
jgi:integrase